MAAPNGAGVANAAGGNASLERGQSEFRGLDVSPMIARKAGAKDSPKTTRSNSILNKFGSLRLTKKKPYCKWRGEGKGREREREMYVYITILLSLNYSPQLKLVLKVKTVDQPLPLMVNLSEKRTECRCPLTTDSRHAPLSPGTCLTGDRSMIKMANQSKLCHALQVSRVDSFVTWKPSVKQK